jgi:hypothetical protein
LSEQLFLFYGKSTKMVITAEAGRVSHRGRSSTKRLQTCYVECAAFVFHKVQDSHSKASHLAIFCSTCAGQPFYHPIIVNYHQVLSNHH